MAFPKGFDKHVPLPVRFWSKVELHDPDKCWLWTDYRDPNGYGRFGIDQRPLLSHRIAYRLANGQDPPPETPFVLHHCDNPPCCNPAHLYAGTQADNVRDAVRRGRTSGNPTRGAAAPNARLTADQVCAIREYRKQGEFYREIAARFDISPSTVGQIVRGETWTHLLQQVPS